MNSDAFSTSTPDPWRKWLLIQAAGIGLALGGVRYYFTHPQRTVVPLPPDLARGSAEVFRAGLDRTRLHGVWLGGHGKRTIIHHHGFGSCGGVLVTRQPVFRQPRPARGRQAVGNNPLTAWPLIRVAQARGYNVLLVDARAHGRSDGPWDRKGNLAATDLAGWVRWLREEQGQAQVGLWGNSYGSVLGLVLATWSDRGGVDAMVLDSPAISGRGLYSGAVRKPFYWLMQPVVRNLANERLLKQIQASEVTLPILLIHGMADAHVPAWHSEEAYQALWSASAPARTELWLVPGANHLEALEVAPALYIERLLGWFERWLS